MSPNTNKNHRLNAIHHLEHLQPVVNGGPIDEACLSIVPSSPGKEQSVLIERHEAAVAAGDGQVFKAVEEEPVHRLVDRFRRLEALLPWDLWHKVGCYQLSSLQIVVQNCEVAIFCMYVFISSKIHRGHDLANNSLSTVGPQLLRDDLKCLHISAWSDDPKARQPWLEAHPLVTTQFASRGEMG